MLPSDVSERYARTWPDETLPQRLVLTARASTGRVAIVDGERSISFGRAAAMIESLAGHLVALGTQPGDVVSWQLPNWWESAIVHHAALRAGAIPNPLNPAFGERELKLIVGQARPRVLFVPGLWRGTDYPELARSLDVEHVVVVRGGLGLEELLRTEAAPPPMPLDPAAHAVLLYTSGTTADPKGVLHTHRGLLYQIATFHAAHRLALHDRYLGAPPVAHIAGLSYGILAPFALGTSTVFLDRWDPAAALDLASRNGATFMTGPPTFLLTLAEAHTGQDLTAFRLFSTGGASIPTEAVRAAGEKLGCEVKRAYGSTEVPFLTATDSGAPAHLRLETDGRALGLNEIEFSDDGEILARGPGMFTGYRDQALNDFTDDGFFRTGDLGALDALGYLRVTGRLKDIIIRGGENISAKELEDLLLQHPSVREAAIVGIPDARLGETVCAVVAGALSFDEMTSFLLGRGIAKHKLPERLEVREILPKTGSGKIRKDALRAELA